MFHNISEKKKVLHIEVVIKNQSYSAEIYIYIDIYRDIYRYIYIYIEEKKTTENQPSHLKTLSIFFSSTYINIPLDLLV